LITNVNHHFTFEHNTFSSSSDEGFREHFFKYVDFFRNGDLRKFNNNIAKMKLYKTYLNDNDSEKIPEVNIQNLIMNSVKEDVANHM
jgi:hypothetical protein